MKAIKFIFKIMLQSKKMYTDIMFVRRTNVAQDILYLKKIVEFEPRNSFWPRLWPPRGVIQTH